MIDKKSNYKKDLIIFLLLFFVLNIIFYLKYMNDNFYIDKKFIEDLIFTWQGRCFYFITIIFPWFVTLLSKLTFFRKEEYSKILILKLSCIFLSIFLIGLFLFYFLYASRLV